MSTILPIDPLHPDPAAIETAVRILRDGGVIAYPTETFYALAADCRCEVAIADIFAIKGRDFRNPIAVIGSNTKDLEQIAASVPEVAELLMETFWPGPLTLILPARDHVSVGLTAGTGKIGMRISSHPVARILAMTLGRPITATSANRSGDRECVSAEEVAAEVGPLIRLILDGGKTPGGKGSTILDLTTVPPVLLRSGAIPEADIKKVLGSISPSPG
jgi:L-threonylcarbamoyladenylate synthase